MIKRLIDSIADDKKDHVLLGMGIGYSLMFLGVLVDLIFGVNFGVLTGGFIGILLVGAKEIVHDGWLGLGQVELLDFVYSAVPILVPMMFYILG